MTVLVVAAFWAAFPASAEGQAGTATDRAALEALYDATGGANWTNSAGWKTDAPLSEWFGVSTDESGRVTGLYLGGNDLTGPIPGELGSLLNLEWLGLGGNDLTGPVPSWLGDLVRLRSLSLGDNALTGAIPGELGSLLNLEWLGLGVNDLTGPVPSWLGDLVRLRSLNLSWNALTGAIPGELGSLLNLEWLGLGVNDLTGPVPSWLGDLVRLRSLSLGDNALTGPIPGELGSLLNLESLWLGDNALTGPVPSSLGNLVQLRALYLRNNALIGPIPDELGSLLNLEGLGLGGNDLTGPVPSWLGDLVQLRSLNLGWNALTGPIPGELGSLLNLESLRLGVNDLTGPVPSWLGDLVRLRSLNLGWNPLTGTLPQDLTRLSELEVLNIRSTGVCAPADAAFQAWLATIDFSGATCNRPPQPVGAIPAQALTRPGPAHGVSVGAYFSDPDDDPLTWSAVSSDPRTVAVLVSGDTVWLVPEAAGAATVTVTARDPAGLSATQDIAVTTAATAGPQSDREVLAALYDATGGANWTDSTNWLTDAPLSEWFGVSTDESGRVTRLWLDNNALTGPIPGELGSLLNLEWLGLGGNDLTGPVPSWLGDLVRLRSLNLGWNALTGPIPGELGSLLNLEWLGLGGNDLTGPVPSWLGDLVRLRSLNLGWNALTGPIPGELGSLLNLVWLGLGGNDLTGPVPSWLGDLVRLRSLNLGWNALTGPIPGELGSLLNLEWLWLDGNDLTGPVPSWLGDLVRLRFLHLGGNDLTGPIPGELGSLVNLESLSLSFAWGLSGALPPGLRSAASLGALDVFATQACAPAAWRDWLKTIEFTGPLCGTETVTIDVAVVHTPAAREAAGGAAAISAVIDLMIAETNQAYATSGVRPRVALVGRAEVQYVETGDSVTDLNRLADPSDGHMDEAHALRDRVGADLVHLIVDADKTDVGGRAFRPGAFGLTTHGGGGRTFAHELGHNKGLRHDRYQAHHHEGGVSLDPAYGYVNQQGFVPGAVPSRRWATIMSYATQCRDAHTACSGLLRFSNPRQHYNGDPLGVPFGSGESGVTGPADAAAVLDATGPAVALWRDHVARPNRPPATVGTLPDRTVARDGVLNVDVSSAFVDPDGDALTYAVSSSAPGVVTAAAAGARVTLTAVRAGTATIRVTVTDPGGLRAAQSFTVTVTEPVSQSAPFTDDPIRPGVTPVRAVHFAELRARIDALRVAAGLGRFGWTDPVLRPGATPVRLVHLLELRQALGAADAAAGRAAPRWTDAAPAAGTTPIRAAHLMELRAAVLALESGAATAP